MDEGLSRDVIWHGEGLGRGLNKAGAIVVVMVVVTALVMMVVMMDVQHPHATRPCHINPLGDYADTIHRQSELQQTTTKDQAESVLAVPMSFTKTYL